MKITINAREVYNPAKHKVGGIARVNRLIVDHLPVVAPRHEFIAYARPDAELSGQTNLKVRPSIRKLIRNDEIGGRLEAMLSGGDVYYSLTQAVPSKGRFKKVTIIHDIVPKTHPEYLRNTSEAYAHRGSEAQRLFDNAVDHADLIQCGSEYGAQILHEHFPSTRDRTFVALNGLVHALPRWTVDQAKTLYLPFSRYLLTLSRIDPRKNFSRLIEAFAQVAKTPELESVGLVIAGADGWGVDAVYEAHQKSGLGDRVLFLSHVPDAQLAELYGRAEWYICPSVIEGFGLPVLEAMHFGVPVLASNAGGIPEVAGSLAHYFDPLNTEAMAETIRSAFADPSQRASTIEQGFVRARQFSPENMARQIVTAFEERL